MSLVSVPATQPRQEAERVLEHQGGPMNGFSARISAPISSTGIGLAK